MALDGRIESEVAFWVWGAVLVFGGNWLHDRWNPRPPRELYRKDGGFPWAPWFWEVYDESKYTAEAIEYHRRSRKAWPVAFATLVASYLLLDLIW